MSDKIEPKPKQERGQTAPPPGWVKVRAKKHVFEDGRLRQPGDEFHLDPLRAQTLWQDVEPIK